MRWALVLCLLSTACAPRPAAPFPVRVRVESDPGNALSGASLSAHGRELGVTNATGLSVASLSGQPGEVIALSVHCPSGHRQPTDPLLVRLRRARAGAERPEYRVLCPPLTRTLVVAIKTTGPRIPVRVLGQEIARTDGQGTAHALLRVAPGDVVLVQLDTSAHPRWMPQSPELRVVMPERDALLLFEQAFKKPRPRRARRKRPTGPTPI